MGEQPCDRRRDGRKAAQYQQQPATLIQLGPKPGGKTERVADQQQADWQMNGDRVQILENGCDKVKHELIPFIDEVNQNEVNQLT
jgi:hypothetical protein